jgi:hypothetical protein
MHIFLSYSSNDRDLANRIHLSLVAQQHDVFFDREDLIPGQEYDNRIAQEIQRTDLFIFLVSPEAVSHGRYTLNELGMIQRRWAHPSGRVLPVMIRPTPMDQIPPYLKAVTIMQPVGDIPPEVADHVRRMKAPRPRWVLWAIGGITAVGLIVALWATSGMSPHVREASDLLQNARSLQHAAEYASAFDKIQAARTHVTQSPMPTLFQHQLVEDIAAQQLAIATAWLDDMHVKEGERFSELVSKLLPTLDEAIATSTGAQKATRLAYRGWADFLRSRDSVQRLEPDAFYRQALAIDPANVYAHTMWGHWITWTRGSFDDAKKHFDSALAGGQQRPYVRDRQLSAMRNLNSPIGDAELVHVVHDMWVNKEPLAEETIRNAASAYYFGCRPSPSDRLDVLLQALPATNHIALLRGLFLPARTADYPYNWLEPCLAILLEKAGLNAEALETNKALKSTLSPRSMYLNDIEEAIKRLSQSPSRTK